MSTEYTPTTWVNYPNTSTPISAENLNHIENGIVTLYDKLSNSTAGFHNSIYRGEYLGDGVTYEQWQAISSGTFDDLFIGDYWTYNNVNYRIAGFDYYLNTGDTICTDHHVVIVPDTCLDSQYIDTDTPYTNQVNGYANTTMRTDGLSNSKNTINSMFGSNHILSHRIKLVDSVSSGKPNRTSWFTSTVDLMSEIMLFGTKILSSMGETTRVYNECVEKSQLPLFRLDHSKIVSDKGYWLREGQSGGNWIYLSNKGEVTSYHYTTGIDSDNRGVRPVFCIK